MYNIVDSGNYNRGMPCWYLKYEQDYVTMRFPHHVVRRILRSYFKCYWKPRFFRCDCKRPFHTHFTWERLVRQSWRLMVHGYTEYRWD